MAQMIGTKKAAEILEVTPLTLIRWRKRKDRNGLKFHRRKNGRIFYSLDVVTDFKSDFVVEAEA